MTNKTRFTAIAIVAAAAFVLVAAVVAAFLVFGRGSASGPAASQDYEWLTAAMATCDTDAEREQNILHFMVIPLTMVKGDLPQWRRVSLNDIGNAILLPSDQSMKALQAGELSISTEKYVFSVRDEKTSEIYKWNPGVGVKRFSTDDGGAIGNFKLQFQTDALTGDAEWGATFVRRPGNCYWVNAVIGH